MSGLAHAVSLSLCGRTTRATDNRDPDWRALGARVTLNLVLGSSQVRPRFSRCACPGENLRGRQPSTCLLRGFESARRAFWTIGPDAWFLKFCQSACKVPCWNAVGRSHASTSGRCALFVVNRNGLRSARIGHKIPNRAQWGTKYPIGHHEAQNTQSGTPVCSIGHKIPTGRKTAGTKYPQTPNGSETAGTKYPIGHNWAQTTRSGTKHPIGHNPGVVAPQNTQSGTAPKGTKTAQSSTIVHKIPNRALRKNTQSGTTKNASFC